MFLCCVSFSCCVPSTFFFLSLSLVEKEQQSQLKRQLIYSLAKSLLCVWSRPTASPQFISFFFVVFISALHPGFDFKFFSRRNEVKLEERICCQTHTSTYHLVWYFKPSRSEAGLRSWRDREGTKLAIDFLFFVVPSLDR